MNTNLSAEAIKEFLNEELIPLKTKLDDYLPVALGIRRSAQIIMPAELPDGTILGATIDERFRLKTRGTGLSIEAIGQLMRSRLGRRDPLKDLRRRMQLLREVYNDVVVRSHSYQAYIRWMGKLGLQHKELESRPTIREVYIFKDPSVAGELDALQDLRKDIRYETMKRGAGPGPVYARAFPEERNAAYLKQLGSILGFPACCVQRYVFDRTTGLVTPEERASNDLKALDDASDLNVFAYFTKDFFPCKPDCAEAASIGKAVHEKILKVDGDLAAKYVDNLRANVSLVREYPDLIKRKIADLEAAKEVTGQPRDAEGTLPDSPS